MKNLFRVDFEKRAIVGSNTAIKKANAGEGKEYRELIKLLELHPDFKVMPKEIATNEKKKKYHGLTFDRMKEYIETQPDSENKLKVFEKVRKIAKAKGAQYPLTKKWFLNTYPEYKENDVSVTLSDDEATNQAETELEATTKITNIIDKMSA